MALGLQTWILPDPDGHHDALALKGDTVILGICDGGYTGFGEASHSGDDAACVRRARRLFDRHVGHLEPTLESVRTLAGNDFAVAEDFVSATAISALDQALHDLVGRRMKRPVWQLYAERPACRRIPVYATLNRALTARDDDDYRSAAEYALELGIRRVKVAPFEAVTPGTGQIAQASRGLEVLRLLRDEFPEMGLRVDCHDRFTPENALALVGEFDALGLDWVEAPCPIGPAHADLRARMETPLAAGELFFGKEPFADLCRRGWVDVIMPDVKYVGGFGPLVKVCRTAGCRGVSASPHNPAGAVATLASAQAAALLPPGTELEIALPGGQRLPACAPWLVDGHVAITEQPGWGIGPDEIVGRGA